MCVTLGEKKEGVGCHCVSGAHADIVQIVNAFVAYGSTCRIRKESVLLVQ